MTIAWCSVAFGDLHWRHTADEGVRQTEKGAGLFATAIPACQSTSEFRNAYLELQCDGKVKGSIRIMLTGNPKADNYTLGSRYPWSREIIMRKSAR